MLGGYEERKLTNSINFLLEYYIFKGWSFAELKELFSKFYEKKFERKSIIFREGENADLIYFIKSGEFKVFLLT